MKEPKDMSAQATPPISTSKPQILLKAVNKPTDEIGAPGLKEFGGFMQEEFVTELRGQQGALRYAEMVNNCPAVDAALSTMKNVAARAIQDGRVEPFSAKSEDGERAEFVEQCLEDMNHSRADMDSEALTMFEYGFAPLEVVYKRRNGFKRDEEASSRFTDELIGWSKVSLRAQESVLYWKFDPEGRHVLGLVQLPAPSYREFTIPIDRLALFRTTAVKGNPEGRSLLRAAFFAWKFFKRGTSMSWVGAERDVTGIPVLKGPADLFAASPTAEQAAGLARLKQIGENVRNDEQACVLLPSDVDPETKVPLYDFSLLSSPGTKTVDVLAMTKDQERQILMVLFSDFLLLGHEKIGTQALFGGRMGLYAMQLDSLLDRYDEVLNRQMIQRLVLLNGWPMDRLPYFKHGTVSETDLDLLGKFLASYATAGGILDPDLDAYVREQAGWPVPTEEGLSVQTTPPVAATPTPTEPATPTPGAPEEAVPAVPDAASGPGPAPARNVAKYSPDQPRDEAGRFGEGGGDGGEGAAGGGYSAREIGAVRTYQSEKYAEINNHLRTGAPLSDDLKTDIRHLDSAISRSPLETDTTLYRGIRHEALSKGAEKLVGRTIDSGTFVSTSDNESIARDFAHGRGGVMFEIKASAGARALSTRKATGQGFQREFILPRGAQFKVTGVRRTGSVPVVTMEYS